MRTRAVCLVSVVGLLAFSSAAAAQAVNPTPASLAFGAFAILSPDASATNLQQVRKLADGGHYSAAMGEVLRLQVEWPRLRDRLSMLEGELWLRIGDAARAVRAFDVAAESLQSDVRALARVERVRALIRNGSPRAEAELRGLLRFYPSLPQAPELHLELADARRQRRQQASAVAIYQRLEIQYPASATAAQARQRLASLQAAGARVPPYSIAERLTRAERLLRTAPVSEARAAIDALQQETKLSKQQSAAATRLAQTLASRSGSAAAPEMRAGLQAQSEEQAQARLRQLLRRRPLHCLTATQLLQVLQIAAPVGWQPLVGEALTALLKHQPSPRARLRAAILAAGVADDALLIELLAPVVAQRNASEAAHYHYARALERAGQTGAALTAYESLLAQAAQSGERYYALWAAQRVEALRRSSTPVAVGAVISTPKAVANSTPRRATASNAGPLAAQLQLLLPAHGDAYPWLARCVDLLHLGEPAAAADELRELYLAWRQAHGRPHSQFGLEAVFRGVSRPRSAVSFKLRKQRQALDAASLAVLSHAAEVLGDAGTALGLGGPERLDRHPRAYAEVVQQAAARFKIDADLLFAVMRVESVYQRGIVSYAGAVGLMQIMPGTGRRIAYHLGDYDFSTDELLEPSVNVEFGAWYLASLLQRFQGRLPLAIAAYNGGPHNVRKWLRGSAPQMPLDAFLEEIPFEQTHRYVRRVLTSYAAYRAKSGKAMQPLDMTLPRPQPDALAF